MPGTRRGPAPADRRRPAALAAPTGQLPRRPGCTPRCAGGARRSRRSRRRCRRPAGFSRSVVVMGFSAPTLALAGAARAVVGVDIDAAKIAQAQAVAGRLGRPESGVRGRHRPARSRPGPWDAIVVVDMLYLLPAARSSGSCWPRPPPSSAPGGMLLVKEMSDHPRVEGRLEHARRKPWRCRSWASPNAPTASHRSRAPAVAAAQSRPRFDFVAPGDDGRLADAVRAGHHVAAGSIGTGCTRTTC